MSTKWGSILSGLNTGSEMSRRRKVEDEQRKQNEEDRKLALEDRATQARNREIQVAAALQGLRDQGVVGMDEATNYAEQNDDGNNTQKLGSSNFFSVPGLKKKAPPKIQQTDEGLVMIGEDGVGKLLADASGKPLGAKRFAPQSSSSAVETFDLKPMMVGGKPQMVKVGNHGTITDLKGNPISDAGVYERPRTPGAGQGPDNALVAVVRNGKTVWEKRTSAAGQEVGQSSSGGEDKVVERVQNPDGTVTYEKRANVVGKQAPTATTNGASMLQRTQALGNVRTALGRFEETLDKVGSRILGSADQSALETEYENLSLQMKEMYNLGVLNGPDLELMRRVVGDPTSWRGRLKAIGSDKEQSKRIKAQIGGLRNILTGFDEQLAKGATTLKMPGAAPKSAPLDSGNVDLRELPAPTKKQTINKDKAEYLKTVMGWSAADIAAQYTVTP